MIRRAQSKIGRLGCPAWIGLCVVLAVTPARSDTLARDGNEIVVKLSILIPGPCHPGPEWKVETGAPAGFKAAENAANFTARLHQTAQTCGRAFVALPEIRVPVEPGTGRLVLYVADRPDRPDRFDVHEYDLSKVRPVSRRPDQH